MIRSEGEYQEALRRLSEEIGRLKEHEKHLRDSGLKGKELKRAMDPLRSFHEQLAEEIESYERLRRGDFGELRNFEGLGRALVGLRIARGMSQRELAERLDVHESQVSRDERNEYHGVTVERASRIFEALSAECVSEIHLDPA